MTQPNTSTMTRQPDTIEPMNHQLDTASSASRQHFIDTGAYLTLDESIEDLATAAGWNCDAWYPAGLHVWNDLHAIVITDFTEPNMFDVGVYSTFVDGDPITLEPVAPCDLVDHIRNLIQTLPGLISTDPLRPEMLAGVYLETVRTDPSFVLGVATCPAHEMFTIVDEVIDAGHGAGLITDDMDADRVWDAATLAAQFARDVCRFERGIEAGL